MRRDAKTDGNQSAIVSALRAIGASVQSLHTVGGGVPDLLWWHPRSGYVLAEVKDGAKSASRRKLTPDQVEWHAAWRGPVHVVESVEQAIAVAMGDE